MAPNISKGKVFPTISQSDADKETEDGENKSSLGNNYKLQRADTSGAGVPTTLRNAINICGSTRTHRNTNSV